MGDALCIVMARGGSKRVPHKNIRLFCGLPMVAWPVKAACESGLFADVVISTEDEAIACAAVNYGATQPFKRPAALADDFTTTAQVLHHALITLQSQGRSLPQYCCCLYGTSAMVTPALLTAAYEKMLATQSQFVMAVSEYAHPIERALQFGAQQRIASRQPDYAPVRTQDIAPSYHDTGLLYWFGINAFLTSESHNLMSLAKTAIVVSRNETLDIDTEVDWEMAELLVRARQAASAGSPA